eukprot:2230872-Ditylum_brightwellii.AAC.1
MQQSSSSPFGPILPVLLPDYDPTKLHLIVLPEYDPNNFTSIGPYQRADWDETHPKANFGVMMKGGRDFKYEFARDSKSRFLFGVATIKLPTGEVVGRRLKPFCYTGRKILSHKDWESQIKQEIYPVKREGTEKTWCTKNVQEKGQIWEDEMVLVMKEVLKKTMKKLERSGIKYVRDMKFLDDLGETVEGICRETCDSDNKNGLTVSSLKNNVVTSKECK